jgi:hypothetical protein
MMMMNDSVMMSMIDDRSMFDLGYLLVVEIGCCHWSMIVMGLSVLIYLVVALV